jgi:hypothetical protein
MESRRPLDSAASAGARQAWQLQGFANAMFDWQKTVMESCNSFEERTINVLVDTGACTGKSTLYGVARAMKWARIMPPTTGGTRMIQIAYGMAMDQDLTALLIDIPHDCKQDKLREMFAAIETIKTGHLYDTRYKYKDTFIGSPTIWVFTNQVPRINKRKDVWKLWTVQEEQLCRYGPAPVPGDDDY